MTPGPSCGIAQSMQARAVVKPTGREIIEERKAHPQMIVSIDPAGEGGVWVTWWYADGFAQILAFYPQEIEALRAAVNHEYDTVKAKFLRWGEEL